MGARMSARPATTAPAAVPRQRPAARPTAWLERERVLGWVLVLPAVAILAAFWRGTPFFAISLLAGLQTIGQDMYEAAAIDGATAAQRFRYVTVPLIRPVLLVVLLFSFIWTISDFQLVYVLTGGGPANSTHLFSTLAYQIAMQAGQLGQGAAVSLAMFPFLLAIVARLLWYLRRHEGLGGTAMAPDTPPMSPP